MNEAHHQHLLRELISLATTHAQMSFCPLPSVGGAELAKEYEAEKLRTVSADPGDEERIRLFRRIRNVTALISKNESIAGSTQVARDAAAWQTFVSDMQYTSVYDSTFPMLYGEVEKVVNGARLEIFRLLGPGPTLDDWATFSSSKVFSKGTIQGIPPARGEATDVDPYAKLSLEQVLTGSGECLEYFGFILLSGEYGRYLKENFNSLKFSEVSYSKVRIVPKDASTGRTIAVEPLLNAMAQQGILAILTPYLRKWGIDLEDQSRNSSLARIASRRGLAVDGFSTVDLSSASNSISNSLVRYLLPPVWFGILDKARTKNYMAPNGDIVPNPCFATMGNAFTFPLECLIFAALTRAAMQLCDCGDINYRVYGDDIIVPSSAALLLVEALTVCGFRPNPKKTHHTGFFRESCGGDYLDGVDVRPTYLRRACKGPALYLYFNELQSKVGDSPVLHHIYNSMPRLLVGPRIHPDTSSDGHLEAPIFFLKKKRGIHVAWNKDVQSYMYGYRTLIPRSRKVRRVDLRRRYLCALLGSAADRHDLRGTARYVEVFRYTTTPVVLVKHSGLWY